MRFRSVLGAFIFVFLVSFVALVVFVQTKTFGRVATRVITDLSQRRAQTEVSIKSIGISVFPPGMELNQVRVKKQISPEKKFESEFGKLGFYIGFIELEERKITLGEIRISDSTIEYSGPSEDDKPLERIDQDIINKIFDTPQQLPIRIDTILLENSRIFVNHDLIEAKRLKLFKRGNSFMTRFHLANLKPLPEEKLTVDEIWGDAEIGRKNINIHRLRIQHDVHTLLVKGKIKNYPLLRKAEANLSGESSVYISNLKEEIELPELIQLEGGYAHVGFRTSLKNEKISGSFDLSISDLESNIAKAEQLIASFELKNEIITLKNLSLSRQKEKLRLLSEAEIFNVPQKKLLYQPLAVNVENLDLNNALGILPALNPLKGQLTGNLTFHYHNMDMEFKPKDGFMVHNLGLVVGENKPFTVLVAQRAKLTSSSFRVINNEFQMESMVELNHSLLDVRGRVNSKRVDFKVKDAIVDLEDLGNISQLDIKGRGTLNVLVSGPLDDAIINITGKTKDFEILGYKLGQTDKDLSIALKDSNVIIHRCEALYKNTPISGTGAINYENSDIALGINTRKSNYHELKEILTPIFSKLTFLPSDLDFNAKADANIFGKTNLDDLKIKAEVLFTDLHAYGETLSNGELTVGLKNQNLTLGGLTATKGKGQLRGDFNFNLKTDKMKLDYEWEELALAGFNLAKRAHLNLNGLISGSLTGEGTTKDYLLKLNGKMDETRSMDHTFENSLFDLKITPSNIEGQISLLGQIINSDFDYSFNKTKLSRINLTIDTPAIKPFATAFLGQHLDSENFSGNFKFSLDTQFRNDFEKVDLKASLERLVFKHESFNVNYISDQPQFLIQDNAIKKWNLSINEPDLHVSARGNGKFGEKVFLHHEINFNSKLFELMLSPVLSADGFIRNEVRVGGRDGSYNLSVNSSSKDLNLTIESVPFPLNHLTYAIDYERNRLVVKELKTSLENGSVSAQGDIYFDDANPDVNLKYILDKAEIPILGKSLINLSGEGIILGNAPPYNIGGEIIINKAHIVNELSDFSSKSNALSQVRFLPPNQESPVGKLVNLNLTVKTDNPVRISNSLMDVSLKGEVMLLGSPVRPRGEGSLSAPANSSRIFFKNNEYFITNADLNFSPKKEISNPDFDVQALTYISSYKVNAKAYGDLERFNFDLTSEPSLSRNSILSLIAFGYSDEIQSTLTQDQQQSLTEVGVGSFVFDRFKISDILNKQFGLQVNLGTVFEQSQTQSMLSGRSQEGPGQIGRTRTATKIELKKRLDEALNLSVSSTMGGSIGQRQSMNLNYSVSKKVQLEGVYELRTNAEGEEDVIDNSIGGDLKFRWTFK